MKKFLSVLLTVTLMLALGVSVFADNGIGGANASSIEIKYSTSENYVVMIPYAVCFSNGDSSATISASDVLLADGTELRVKMTSKNNFSLKNGDSFIPYQVSGDSDGIVLIVSSGSTSGTNTLEFSLGDTANATLAGEHKDVLSFECGVFVVEKETEDTTSGGSSSGSGSNKLITQNPTLGADVVGQAGAAGNAAEGGGQELGPYGENPRPTPENPDPEPQSPHPDPYQWQY